MKYFENDFTKELSELLTRHHVTLRASKSGIAIIESSDDTEVRAIIAQATSATESDNYQSLIFFRFHWDEQFIPYKSENIYREPITEGKEKITVKEEVTTERPNIPPPPQVEI